MTGEAFEDERRQGSFAGAEEETGGEPKGLEDYRIRVAFISSSEELEGEGWGLREFQEVRGEAERETQRAVETVSLFFDPDDILMVAQLIDLLSESVKQ